MTRSDTYESLRGRAAQPRAPSLDSCSLNDSGPSYACIHRDFGGGRFEVTGTWMEAGAVRRGGSKKRDPDAPVVFGRADANIRRAKSETRRRSLVLAPDRILTLTKRGKFASAADLWDTFERFGRLMRKLYGAKWRYVAVPELHSDGFTYHMHCAIVGFYWVGMVRRLWYKALGGRGDESGSDTPGNIDITPAFRGSRTVSKVAGYIAKYVSKSAHLRERGGKLFASSRGLYPNIAARWRETFSLGLQAPYRIIGRLFCDRSDLTVAWWSYGGCHGFTIKPPDC